MIMGEGDKRKKGVDGFSNRREEPNVSAIRDIFITNVVVIFQKGVESGDDLSGSVHRCWPCV